MTFMNREEELESIVIDLQEKLKELQEGDSGKKSKKIDIEPISKRLEKIDKKCDSFFEPDCEIKPQNRLIVLRDYAQEIRLKITPDELRTRIWDARKRSQGTVEDYTQNDVINAPPDTWAWEKIIMMSDTNLITASPKVGKTTLVVEMLSKWNTDVLKEHLGFEFKGKCPKVILIGTDMPNSRWMPLLAKFGLAKPIGKDGYQFVDPIIAYFSMDRPLHLDDEGLSKIADLCSKNLNCILLLDSYEKCCPAGIDEKSNYFSQPLKDLQEVTAPYNVTNIIIHHSSAEGAGSNNAVNTSRGHTSLPAGVSQIINMKWLNKDEDLTDDRIVLHTMGRSVSTRVIVEQFDTGFKIKGSYEEVMKEKSQERKIEKLTERQQDIYQIIKEHKIGFMTPKYISNKEEIQYSKKDSTNTDICRRTCEQLVAKKLLSREKVTTEEGTENRYRLIQ